MNGLAWPIPIPDTAAHELVCVVNDLNEGLNYWGYREDQDEVWQRLTRQYEHAERGGVLEEWRMEAQDRVSQGEEVLACIRDALMDLPARGLSQEILCYLWARMTAASLNVQYIIAATKVHIGLAVQDVEVL